MSDIEPGPDQRDKKRGSTTLEECGWCIHASGTHRYNYCIEGTCGIMPSLSDNKVRWFEECHLKTASKHELHCLQRRHQQQIKGMKATISKRREAMKALDRLKKTAPLLPELPTNRPSNFFNLGDPVMVWIDNGWHEGVVREGYRHHDGMVSYQLEDIGPQEPEYWGCGASFPSIMHLGTWLMFSENPEMHEAWRKRQWRIQPLLELPDIPPIDNIGEG